MANVDAAFRVIDPRSKKSVFHIWRIEKMNVVSVPKEQYGNFYKGDSYIVLSVAEEGDERGCNVKMKEIKGRMDVHIHFWLGSDTTQDEAGVAAYKTVELDDYMGGGPVQHREVEGHESKLFMNYFKPKGGIKYLEGGHASGFNHVEHKFRQRLLHVKGKHHVRVTEAAGMQWSAMNHGDVFILDLGRVLFVWNGKEASVTEKRMGCMHASSLRDERAGKMKTNIIIVEDGTEDKMDPEELKMFSQHLPLNERNEIQSKEAGGQDDKVDRKHVIKLYVCSEDEGTLKVSEVKSGPLSRKDMHTGDSYIIDNGSQGLWTWIGKGSSKKERSEAMRNAIGFINKKGLDPNTSVTRVVEDGEPTDFKCLFRDWPQPKVEGKVYSRNRVAKTIQTKFDATTLHENRQLAAETQMFDDGSGRAEVWRVENFDLVPQEKHHMGKFFGGDCYVIQYSYPHPDNKNHVIYYWQGAKSTTDERGTSALKAVEMDDALGGAAVQVRVVQGKEPIHFMAIFDGKMIIFEGGKAGWENGEKSTNGPGDTYMLQVRGTNPLNTKAVQVDLDAESLNSNDVFVIFSKKAIYIWSGKGSTGDEREMAKRIASASPRNPTMVFEGQEKEDFWNCLGGKKPYSSDKRLQEPDSGHPARLFQLSNAAGKFTCDEIPDFAQPDLVEDDVMILDVWDSVYIWIGSGANQQEKKEAARLAQEYIDTDPAGRDPDTPMYMVKQGMEPPTFTGFFGLWDRDMWSKGQSYQELMQHLGDGNEALTLVKAADVNGEFSYDSVPKYPLEQLAVSAEELPNGVDPSCKEIHLSPEDFDRLFKMKYQDFVTKPQWKQQELKKKFGIF
ncbi:advillin-like isoform X1 [Mytilus californianus]|uniref:advillin-like isoform X1 n=1 Tax=Mytilus californianus TaxID=6549 RepID=UPI002247BB58|nr:advillin-like isoform X1 [Mytilus californianus]XP_052079405.1 advillin-like isoform X1 [Mytilus californianus]XP_052079406.1 advillin-like isoform X1 [Mytilus californianus]XP_052079407.1 advillin-like isoform X1 [Mytilus californianus]XP_052079408.1 advillin-like isoform X1 [Mytilus californianus]